MDGIFLSEETSKMVVDVIHDSVAKKVPFVIRGLVKPAIRIGMNMLNKYADQVIPDKIDGLINSAIQKANSGDWIGASVDIGEAGDALVDIKYLDDANERMLFVSIAQSLVQGIKTWIEK